MLRTKLPIASRSSWSRISRMRPNMPSVSVSAGPRSGMVWPGRRGRVSSACSHARHAGPAPGAGAAGPPWRARARAASAAFVRLEFSRMSSRKVLKRNVSTSRRTGRTSPSAGVLQPLAVAAQAREAVFVEALSRDLVRDEGVAVPVTADPRSALEEGADLPALVRIGVVQRALQLLLQLRYDVEEILVDEIQPPGELLGDGGLLEPQLARQPQQFDLGAETVDQAQALPRGPARRLEVHEPPIDAAVPLEHGDAFRLGRMSGDHGPDAQVAHERAHLVGAHAGGGGRRHHLGEGPAQLLVAALDLALAPLPHRGVLLGPGEQLEPDTL